MQILFSLSSFQNYIEENSFDNQVVCLIIGLAEDIKCPGTSVITSTYVFCSQHDATDFCSYT